MARTSTIPVIRLGSETIRLQASPQAAVYYNSAFGSSMAVDVALVIRAWLSIRRFEPGEDVETILATVEKGGASAVAWESWIDMIAVVGILRLIWAMAKAGARDPETWPDPIDFTASLGEFTIADSIAAFGQALQIAWDGVFGPGGTHTFDPRSDAVISKGGGPA